MSAQRLAFTLAYAASLASCKNANHCAGNPLDDCRLMWDAPPIQIDAADTCSGNIDCKAPTTVCDLSGTMMCVQCTTSDNPCPTAMPICITNQCQKCTAHTQCPASNVCLLDGSCADETQVAYVAMGGSGTACTKANPCRTLDDGLNANKPIVKIAAGLLKDNKITTISGRTVTILADPGAKLDRDGDGPVLQVQNNGTDVSIYDLEITGASGGGGADGVELMPNGGNPKLTLTRVKVTGNNDIGILVGGGTLALSQSTVSGNPGGGISISGGTLTLSQTTVSDNASGGISASGGTLTLSQSTVSVNPGLGISVSGATLTVSQSTVSGNPGGGISISNAQFDIVNTFIVQNGSALSLVGGLDIGQIPASGTHRLDFNTIANNVGTPSLNTGINCGTVAIPLVFNSNIIYNNMVTGGGKQLGGSAMCSASHSDVGPDPATGGSNINADPMFVSVAQNNFHLMSSSPAKDTADPAATLAIDIDGDVRPQGPQRDIGADEVKQ